MDVLNFAHGAFLTAGAYAAWWATDHLPGAGPSGTGFVVAAGFGVAVGAVLGAVVELTLIRPLYKRHIEQVLVTVGLGLAGVALLQGIWGSDPRPFPRPDGLPVRRRSPGATVPNDRFLLLAAAVVVLLVLVAVLRFTRIGL